MVGRVRFSTGFRLLFTLLVFAARSADAVLPFEAKSTTFERGPFSFGLGAHQTKPDFVFPDGSFIDYPGFVYSGYLDVQIWSKPNGGEVRAFAMLLQGRTRNGQWEGDTLARNETLLGLKAYANTMFFAGLGIGTESLKRTDGNGSFEYSNPVYAMNLGVDVPLNMNIYISLQGWYKFGTMKRNQNDSLRVIGNVAFEVTEFAISLVWSPSTSYSTPK